MIETEATMDVLPGLRWRTRDVASFFPPSARLPLLRARAAKPDAGPGHHKAVARALLELERVDEAWDALAPVMNAFPDKDARLLAGIIHQRAGRLDAAIDHLRGVLAEEPATLEAVEALAQCLESRGRHREALAVLEQGLRHGPGRSRIWSSLIATALSSRDAAFLERALAELAPPDRYIACVDDARVFLAEEAGDRATLERMLLAPGLVSEVDLLAPDDPLLAAVLAEADKAADYIFNPYGRAIAGGRQTAFAITSDRPAWASLFERARGEIDRYLAALAQTGAPFDLTTRDVHLRPWIARLGSGGYQKPHIHPVGWITGVIYLAVPPEALGADDGAGCLEMPLLHHHGLPDWRPRRIQPVPGKLVLFPSYVRHSTIPFHGERERVCIAFDLLAI